MPTDDHENNIVCQQVEHKVHELLTGAKLQELDHMLVAADVCACCSDCDLLIDTDSTCC